MSSNKVIFKRSSVAGRVPTSGALDYGEVALNYSDGRLYFKNSDNAVQYFEASSTGSGISAALDKVEQIADSNGSIQYAVQYQVGFVEVHINGVRLNSTDFTANNGVSVTIPDLVIGDEVSILGFRPFSVSSTSKYHRQSYVATEGQDTFAIEYERTLDTSFVQVYVNGVLLKTSEYTADSGTDIILDVAASLDDVVECIGYTDFIISNGVVDLSTTSIGSLNDVDITTVAPSDGQALVWDTATSSFIPGDSFSQSDFDTAFALKSILDLGIVDGTIGQILTTDGAGGFTFEDAPATYTDTDVGNYLTANSYATETFVGTAISTASSNYATAEQGALADTALQSVAFTDLTSTPTTLAGYGITDAFDGAYSSLTGTPTTLAGYGITDAFDGAYGSLTGAPTLGTAAAEDVSAFATAAQGALADSALQSSDLIGYATESYVDTAIAGKDNTDEITEGVTNLYYTDARVETKIDAYVTGGTGVTVTSGEISIGQSVATTDNVEFVDITATGNVQIDGNLVVSGTTTSIVADNLAVYDNMIYLNNAIQTTITDAVGNGTIVVYTTSETHNYAEGMSVSISGIDPTAYNLSEQIITAVTTDTFTIENSATGTYVSGGTARARTNANPDLGWAAGRYDGGYGHAGVFRDATDGVFKFFDGYTPEPDASAFIDTSHASFALAPIQASSFTGDLIGDVTGTVSSLSNHDTDGLTEGSTNLYYTDARVGTYLTTNAYATEAFVGSAITTASADYATAAQGALADSALQSVAFADLTTTPTTLAGYGITDAPSTLTDLGIVDGTVGQVLTTDGAGGFTFQDVDFTGYATETFVGSAITTASADYATAAQGALADTALQSVAFSDLGIADGTAGQVLTTNGSGVYTFQDTAAAYGDSDVASYLSSNGYDTASNIIAAITDSAPTTLDTLNELAAALGDDANFATTTATAIGLKANTADLATVATTGAYADLTGKPTIPTTITDLGITDGTFSQVLSTDGEGNFTFVDAAAGATPIAIDSEYQKIIADGVTAAYTLDNTVLNAANIIVSVESVLQTPVDAYDVNNTTLTFTSVPAAGAVIVVRFINAAPSTGGTGLIEYSEPAPTTTTIVLDSFATSEYRSGEYIISCESPSLGYHTLKLIVIHDGTTVSYVQYGDVIIGAEVGIVSAHIVETTVEILFTGNSTDAIVTFKRIMLTPQISESPSEIPSDLMTGSGTIDLMSGTSTTDLHTPLPSDLITGSGTIDLMSGTSTTDLQN